MSKSLILSMLSKSPKFKTVIMMNTCMTRRLNSNYQIFEFRSPLFRICYRQKESYNRERCNCMYSSDSSQCDSDSDSEDSIKKNDFDDELCQKLRHFRNPEFQDSIIIRLRECASIQDVFDIICKHENELDGYHACQAILILWDLQRIYKKMYSEPSIETELESVRIQQLVKEYKEKVLSHSHFKIVISVIEKSLTDLTPDAITCIFLYLRRIGMPFDSLLMIKLLIHIETMLGNEEFHFPLSALSRFTVTLKEFTGFTFLFSVQKALPVILKHIDRCKSEDDIYLLSICLQNITFLVNPDSFNAFKNKVNELITNGAFCKFNPSLTVETATVFNNAHIDTIDVKRKLMMLLKGKISHLNRCDLIKIHQVVERQLEPADLYPELSKHVSDVLSEEKSDSFKSKSVDLLACLTLFCPPRNRRSLENLTYTILKQQLNPKLIGLLFKILRSLKTSNIELCNLFWTKTLEVMTMYPEEHSYINIGKYSYRYMFFNNNLGGTFRHYDFENQLKEWYLTHYDAGIIESLPSKFVKMIGFLIAYCDKPNQCLYNKLVLMINKLEEMAVQLHPKNCGNLSRGIKISKMLKNATSETQYMYNIYVRLNSILNKKIKEHIDICDNKLFITNVLMQSYVARKGPQTTDVLQNLVVRYERFNGHINSRLAREAAYNFLTSKCLVPKMIDCFADYVVHNGEHMFGETVELILFLCFYLGYTPSNVDSFLKVTSKNIVRECDRLSGLLILQSSLALCFFRSLPKELVEFIFSVDFLERLDEEIADCYAKAIYPAHIRNYLMQLNRAVCMDYPEFDIPWFHKKYCEGIAATDFTPPSAFSNDVNNVLIEVLGDKRSLKTNSYSFYGYRLDFELFINHNNIPVSSKQRYDKKVRRKAVLLLTDDAFSSNVKSVNGFHQMKKRHLEMLGYDVIEIEQTVWNSMYMSEPGMKQDFCRKWVYDDYHNTNSSVHLK